MSASLIHLASPASAPNSQPPGPQRQVHALSDQAKVVIQAEKQQAEAIAIVLALFAGALVSLAQVVENVSVDNTSNSWQALRIFLYGSIMLSLTGAFLSLVTIKMCSDLPLAYYQRQFRNTRLPTPSDAVVSSHPIDMEEWSRMGILLDAGMTPSYSFVDIAGTCVLVTSGISTFVTLMLWVFLNSQNHTAIITTMVFFVPAAFVVIWAFVIASRGEGWS